MIRKYLRLAALCLGLFLAASAAQAQTPLQALYKAAKAEGEVHFYTPTVPPVILPLLEAFSKEFPDVRVKHFEMRLEDIASRLIAEAKQGTVSLDVDEAQISAAVPLLDRGLIQSYNDWPKILPDLDPAAMSKDGRMLDFNSLVTIVAYNSSLVKPEEVPVSWDDLLAPKWKGKIIVEPRGYALGFIGIKWGKEKMVDYLKKLKANNPIYVKGGTTVVQQLAAGAAPLAVGTYAHNVLVLKNDGASVDWARRVTPIGSGTHSLYIMKGAPHPNAARLLAGWLATEKAQALLNKNFLGRLLPRSSWIVAQEMQKNKVEVVRETPENYKEVAAMIEAAVKALDVLR